jgi:phosphate/phosphite/phosphonate ABC transporter binding protein
MKLVFGVVRSAEGERVDEAVSSLCEELSKGFDATLISQRFDSYTDIARALRDNEVAVAWLPPLMALALEADSIVHPLALPVRHGRTTYQSALIVPRAAAHDVLALKGKRVAWVHPESAAGYLVPRLMLSSRGIDPSTFFGTETFYESHDLVVDALIAGLADVAGTFCSIDPDTGNVISSAWTMHDGSYSPPVEIVMRSNSIPHDVVVVHTSLGEKMRGQILERLLSPTEAAARGWRAVLRADSFAPASQEHFDALRALQNTVDRARVSSRPPPATGDAIKP